MLLSLALRMVRGGGRAAWTRLLLMSAGIAAAALAALITLAIPHALGAGAQRASTRMAHLVDKPAGTFDVSTVEDSIGQRPLSRVLLHARAGKQPPAPVGCRDFSRPGEDCVSPALAREIRSDPLLRRRLGGQVTQTIGASGLTSPDELFIYQGVRAADLLDSRAANGWAPTNGPHTPTVSRRAVTIEVALLTGAPALLLVVICAQLGSATRARRTRSLSLLGMSSRELGAIAAFDGAVAGLLGSLAALLLYLPIGPLIAQSGLAAGYQWFPSDGRPSWGSSTLIVCASALIAAAICRLNVQLSRSRSQTRRQRVWLRATPLWLGTTALGVMLIVFREQLHTAAGILAIFAAGGLLVIGVVAMIEPFIVFVSATFAARSTHLSIRLACRRLQWEPQSASRVLLALVLLVITAGVSNAVLRDIHLLALPTSSNQAISVDAFNLTPRQRDQASTIAAKASVGVVSHSPAGPPTAAPNSGAPDFPIVVEVAYARCTVLVRVAGVDSSSCHDGRAYRMTYKPHEIPDGQPSPGTVIGSGTNKLMVPRSTLDCDFDNAPFAAGALVVTKPSPVGGWPQQTRFVYTVANNTQTISRFQDDLARISPPTPAELQSVDFESLQVYRVHSGVIDLATALGFLLGLIAFVVASIDRSQERRRNVTALLALGVPPGVIRRTQIWQLLLPAVFVLPSAALAGHLIGTAYLTAAGTQRGWYPGSLFAGLALTAVALLVIPVAGIFGARPRIEAANLRAE